jgi:hypothetical protein
MYSSNARDPILKRDKSVANLHPGDQVCVMAHCSREGQLGIVEGLLPTLEEDQNQACVIAFVSETGGMVKESYLVKDLRVWNKGSSKSVRSDSLGV